MIPNAELQRYRQRLEQMQRELTAAPLAARRLGLPRSPEIEEEAQMNVLQDLAVLAADQQAALLRQVRAALDRMAEGSYGICLSCGLPISRKRLDIVPWASYCTACQEAFDREMAERAQPAELPSEEAEPWQSAA